MCVQIFSTCTATCPHLQWQRTSCCRCAMKSIFSLRPSPNFSPHAASNSRTNASPLCPLPSASYFALCVCTYVCVWLFHDACVARAAHVPTSGPCDPSFQLHISTLCVCVCVRVCAHVCDVCACAACGPIQGPCGLCLGFILHHVCVCVCTRAHACVLVGEVQCCNSTCMIGMHPLSLPLPPPPPHTHKLSLMHTARTLTGSCTRSRK